MILTSLLYQTIRAVKCIKAQENMNRESRTEEKEREGD